MKPETSHQPPEAKRPISPLVKRAAMGLDPEDAHRINNTLMLEDLRQHLKGTRP